MRFLVDAQLPRCLAANLKWSGHDAVHTLDLPLGNRTQDWQINKISVEEQRVVITKDADFVNSFLIKGVPYKLLLVSTGNINNRMLEKIFVSNLPAILGAMETYDFVELTISTLILHK